MKSPCIFWQVMAAKAENFSYNCNVNCNNNSLMGNLPETASDAQLWLLYKLIRGSCRWRKLIFLKQTCSFYLMNGESRPYWLGEFRISFFYSVCLHQRDGQDDLDDTAFPFDVISLWLWQRTSALVFVTITLILFLHAGLSLLWGIGDLHGKNKNIPPTYAFNTNHTLITHIK